MKRKLICFFLALVLFLFSSCAKSEIDQALLYRRINELTANYKVDYIHYQTILTATDRNIVLHNEGEYKNEDGVCTYTYTVEKLNRIDSEEESLISKSETTIVGEARDMIASGLGVADGTKVFVLNFKDSFKTHAISQEDDYYVMSGYIARNTIIKFTDNIDDDIRFYYKLTVDKDITIIKEMVISYITTNFDSVEITIRFNEEDA